MVNGAVAPVEPATTADAVRAQVRRIGASPQFASAGKLFRFLEFIVEESLQSPSNPPKEYSIGVSVYGRPASYDPRTDAIVRVEAGKLRARLAQYYDESGFTDPVRISVPKGAYAPAFEVPPPRPKSLAGRVPRNPLPRWFWLALLPFVFWTAIYFAVRRASSSAPAQRLVRISPERRFAIDPSPSPDGRLIAYAADESASPYLNIWIYDRIAQTTRRLTRHDANDSSPSFSSDGHWVAFRSDEAGGGIYLVPAGGGQPALLVSRGREPRFSPTGPLLAYWVASDEETAEFGRAFLLDTARARGPYPKPDPLFQGFAHVRSPVWSDTATSVLALGTAQSDVPEKEYDAWTIRIDRGHPAGIPRKTGLFPLLRNQGLFRTVAERNAVRAGAWSKSFLYLAIPSPDNAAIVRVRLPAAKSRTEGGIETIVPGTERFSAPWSVPGGILTFATSRLRYDVWSMTPESGARATPVTTASGTNLSPSISPSGRILAWQSMLPGQGRVVRALDLATGYETELARGAADRPVVSPDGRRIAWRAMHGTSQAIHGSWISEPGKVEKLCPDCGLPVSWTPEGTRILFETGDPNTGIGAFDVIARTRSPVLNHPSYSLYGARFLPASASSSDGWLLFYAATGGNTRQIFVTAIRDYRADRDAHWIPITEGRSWDVEPCWSEAGDMIYFVSQRGAMRSIWAQRLDRATKQPVGAAFLVFAPPSASQTLLTTLPNRRATGLTAAGGRLFFAMDERESGAWLLEKR